MDSHELQDAEASNGLKRKGNTLGLGRIIVSFLLLTFSLYCINRNIGAWDPERLNVGFVPFSLYVISLWPQGRPEYSQMIAVTFHINRLYTCQEQV
jgi:hypothetical protein